MNELDFCQNPKNLILSFFLTQRDFFFQTRALSLFLLYNYQISCKKSEKTEKPILRFCVANGWMDGRTDGRTDGRMNKIKFNGHFR